MNNVLSINVTPKTRSKTVQESIVRLRRVSTRGDCINVYHGLPNHYEWTYGSAQVKPTHDLCANIRFHKEHGKLPNNVDMKKVQGKGMWRYLYSLS